jgi:outer membrane protein TolC
MTFHRLVVMLVASSGASLAQAQEPPFPLEDALRRLERAPAVVQARQKLQQAEADVQLAQTQMNLRLEAGAQTSYAWTTPASSAPFGIGVSLGVSTPIGPSSAPALALRQAELAAEALRIGLRQTQSDLARRVVQAYVQVVLAESQRAQNALLLELAQRQTAATEEQQRLGAATPTQVLNARLSTSTAQQNLNKAEFDWRDRRSNLANALGLAALPGRPVLPTDLPTLPSLEQLVPRIEESPAVAQARVALEQARVQVDRAGGLGLSGLSLSLGLASDQFGASLGLTLPDYSGKLTLNLQPVGVSSGASGGTTISLGASIPVWDGGNAGAAMSSATLGFENAQRDLEQARQDVRFQLEAALAQAALDRQSLPVQQEAVEVAQSSLAEVRQRLALGSLTALDELAARASSEAAQGSLLAAQTRILEDLYQVYAVLGVGGL